MKNIKVIEANAAAIEAILAEINGAATAHTYTKARQIIALAARAEAALLALIKKKDAVGAMYCAVSGEKVAHAYKYPRRATGLTLGRRSQGWYILLVGEVSIGASGGYARLALTPAQDAAAVAKMRGNYAMTTTDTTAA